MDENVNANVDNQPKCNCEDIHVTAPCPVHYAQQAQENIKERNVVIDDQLLLSKEPQRWVGHCFMCPICRGHVMHDNRFCPSCGQKLSVQSATVTAYIRSMYPK